MVQAFHQQSVAALWPPLLELKQNAQICVKGVDVLCRTQTCNVDVQYVLLRFPPKILTCEDRTTLAALQILCR